MEFLNNVVFSYFGEPQKLEAITANILMHGPELRAAAGTKREPYAKVDGVAVVNLNGPMYRGIGERIAEYYGLTDTGILTSGIRQAASASDVDAIVIRVNSPGGSVDGLYELGEAVKAATLSKPVVAVVDGMAGSAAYYAIAGASRIYAGKMDLIGSIGTRMVIHDYSKMFENAGVKAIAIDTGEHKSAGEPGTVITDAQIEEFQRLVDGYFAEFMNVVRSGRGLAGESLEAVSDGRMFFANDGTSESALALGLIDDVEYLENVIKLTQSTVAAKRRYR